MTGREDHVTTDSQPPHHKNGTKDSQPTPLCNEKWLFILRSTSIKYLQEIVQLHQGDIRIKRSKEVHD